MRLEGGSAMVRRLMQLGVVIWLFAQPFTAQANHFDDMQQTIAKKVRDALRTSYLGSHSALECRTTIQCEDRFGMEFGKTRVKVVLVVNNDELVRWMIGVHHPSASKPLLAIYNFFKADGSCPSGGSAI